MVCSAVVEPASIVVVALVPMLPSVGAGIGMCTPEPTVYGEGKPSTHSLQRIRIKAGLLLRAVAQLRTMLGSCAPLVATNQNFLGVRLGPMTHILYRDSSCRRAGRRSQKPCQAHRPWGAFPATVVKRPVQAPAINTISVHGVVSLLLPLAVSDICLSMHDVAAACANWPLAQREHSCAPPGAEL